MWSFKCQNETIFPSLLYQTPDHGIVSHYSHKLSSGVMPGYRCGDPEALFDLLGHHGSQNNFIKQRRGSEDLYLF